MPFAQTNAFRRDLHQFVILDELQGLLQRHALQGRQLYVFVLQYGSDVGQLLRLKRVDRQVIAAAMNADNLSFVHLIARLDHHSSSLLQIEQGVRDGFAGAV